MAGKTRSGTIGGVSFVARSLRVFAAGALSLAMLTACSSGEEESPAPSESVADPSSGASTDPGQDPSSEPEASPSDDQSGLDVIPAEDLSAITVSDDDVPEVSFEAPWAIESTTAEVLRPAEGSQQVSEDSVVTINYVGVNGTTGEIFDSSYEAGQPVTMSLAQVITGFRTGLDGQTVGSRVLVGMPSSDGYEQGTEDGSIQPGDSLVFVIDILGANFEEAVGEEVPPVEGMPTVSDEGGEPQATIDTAQEPPAELQTATLIQGPGAEVTEESMIQVRYKSWVWASGEPFEESWAPQTGQLAGLIEGWRQGLVGQTAGSRVLLVVPPELAYPEGRAQEPTLEAGQTLVYVIEILDVQNS